MTYGIFAAKLGHFGYNDLMIMYADAHSTACSVRSTQYGVTAAVADEVAARQDVNVVTSSDIRCHFFEGARRGIRTYNEANVQ